MDVNSLILLATALTSVIGVLVSNRMTIYRIEQLEKKMDKHNCLLERMALAESSLKSVHKRVDELKDDFDKLQ